MYIKQIILQGFTSYRDRITITLDKGHNVLVGANGAGKSNIFRAVEFVLHAPTRNVRAEVRYSVGTTNKISTFVELVFDNSDHSLPFDEDEVRVQRSLNNTTNQYHVNNCKVSKNEITNLFVNKYPMNIMKEDYISKIANSSDSFRLKLLEEALGSKAFEQQLEIVAKILKQTDLGIDIAEGHLKVWTARKQNLELSVSSLQYLQSLQNDKSALMHHLRQLEKQQEANQIIKIEEKIKQLVLSQNELIPKIIKIDNETIVIKANCDVLEHKLSKKNALRDVYKDNLDQLWENKTNYELQLHEVQMEIEKCSEARDLDQKWNTELQELLNELNEIQQRLDVAKSHGVSLNNEKYEYMVQLKENKQQRAYLLQKQKRTRLGEVERKRVIHDELKILNTNAEKLKQLIPEYQSKLLNCQNSKQKQEEQINSQRQACEQLKLNLTDSYKKTKEVLVAKKRIVQNIGELCFDMRDLHSNYGICLQEKLNLHRLLLSLVDRNIIKGCMSMSKMIKTLGDAKNIPQQVMNCFECDAKFYKAIEAAIGSQLFCYVFDKSNVLEQITGKLEKDGFSGKIAMISLDAIATGPRTSNQSDSMLINKLTYEPKYKQLMRLLFGNIQIIDEITLENVEQLLVTGRNYVTIDGAYLTSNGRFYVPPKPKPSVIEVSKKETANTKELDDAQSDLDSIYSELEIAQSLFADLEESRDFEDFAEQQTELELIGPECGYMNNLIEFYGVQITDHEDTIAQLKSELLSVKLKSQLLNSEQQQGTVSGLSATEQELLEELNQRIPQIQQVHFDSIGKLAELDIKGLTDRLHFCIRRCYEMETKIVSCLPQIVQEFDGEVASIEVRVKEVDERIQQITIDAKNNINDIPELKKPLNKMMLDWEKASLEKSALQENLQTCMRNMKVSNGILNRLKKPDDLQNLNIDELIPAVHEKSLEKFARLTRQQLTAELKKIDNLIKNVEPVNMEVSTQLQLINQAISSSTTTLTHLKTANDQIENSYLRYQRIEAEVIPRAFETMKKYFSTVFKKLVPTGEGELILRRADGSSEATSSNSDLLSDKNVYSGVGIKVRFNDGDEVMDMIRLSGGQKSLVAVAFALTLQVLAPAPFFLMDEIDRALDVQYRARLAEIIQELSEKAQFITSSHWPEQLETANRLFGVQRSNKVSTLRQITLEEAKKFVKRSVVSTTD